ncbi:MAG TPA: porin family protein [Bryobacteraceae bacterium]|jgi:outer membrane protein W|nr:porin family protein [Bryobacteraceae bacterium]
MTKRLALIVFLGSCPAWGQLFSAGVKGGVPLTDFFSTVSNQSYSFNPNTSRYIIGPTAEIHFPFGIGVEVDALYRHMSYTSNSVVQGIAAAGHFNSGNWEFPLLLKYRFPAKVVRPYVDAGVAWDTLSGISQSVASSVSNGSVTVVKKDTTAGFVIGAGVDLHFVVHIMPEIRYTRWGSTQVIDPTTFLKSNQNQAEFLLGITF